VYTGGTGWSGLPAGPAGSRQARARCLPR
jgi:hypothetical protein